MKAIREFDNRAGVPGQGRNTAILRLESSDLAAIQGGSCLKIDLNHVGVDTEVSLFLADEGEHDQAFIERALRAE